MRQQLQIWVYFTNFSSHLTIDCRYFFMFIRMKVLCYPSHTLFLSGPFRGFFIQNARKTYFCAIYLPLQICFYAYIELAQVCCINCLDMVDKAGVGGKNGKVRNDLVMKQSNKQCSLYIFNQWLGTLNTKLKIKCCFHITNPNLTHSDLVPPCNYVDLDEYRQR